MSGRSRSSSVSAVTSSFSGSVWTGLPTGTNTGSKATGKLAVLRDASARRWAVRWTDASANGIAPGAPARAVLGALRHVVRQVLTELVRVALPVEPSAVQRLGQTLAERVDGHRLVAAQDGRRDGQVDRRVLGIADCGRAGQTAEGQVQRGQEVLVALQQRSRRALERLPEEGLDPALVAPDVAQQPDVGEVVDLREGQCRAVDAAGRRPRDHVRPGRGPAEREQRGVHGVGLPLQVVLGLACGARESVELEHAAAHPDREAHPAVEDDPEADLLLRDVVVLRRR